jgi:hypothetical protein
MWSGITGPIHVLLNLRTVFDFSNPENLMRVIYYGASKELFFLFFNLSLGVFLVGVWRREFLWGVVRGLEGFANVVGRTVAWAGLLMVLQQIMVIFLQSVAWYSDSLKFYNALIVCLCVSYTFVQGGHVRVDLFYSTVSHRAKRIVDMFGALLFMVPATVLTWFYAWYFLWRHLITPPVNASDTLERTLAKARAVRWNIETTGFSPNGFNAYFLFKVLILLFCLMVLVQAVAFFYRSWLEYVEGEKSAGRYLDKDTLGDPMAERVAEIH